MLVLIGFEYVTSYNMTIFIQSEQCGAVNETPIEIIYSFHKVRNPVQNSAQTYVIIVLLVVDSMVTRVLPDPIG